MTTNEENKSAMLKKLIQYFVYNTKGQITKTQLFKFIYLADLYSVKWTGKQFTELEWCLYLHGPWTKEIENALAQMDGKEIIQEKSESASLIRIGPQSTKEMVNGLDLPDGVELLLENIRREWAGTTKENIQNLLEYVYETAPMVEARNNHLPEEKATLNLKKEREKLLAELEV